MMPSSMLSAGLLAMLLLAAPEPARAESLRCHGASASEGDTRLSVLYKCGQPLLADSWCAPVYVAGAMHPLPSTIGAAVLPCQAIEEWLYDRGPGNLMASVRFRDGKVLSIRYGRQPR